MSGQSKPNIRQSMFSSCMTFHNSFLFFEGPLHSIDPPFDSLPDSSSIDSAHPWNLIFLLPERHIPGRDSNIMCLRFHFRKCVVAITHILCSFGPLWPHEQEVLLRRLPSTEATKLPDFECRPLTYFGLSDRISFAIVWASASDTWGWGGIISGPQTPVPPDFILTANCETAPACPAYRADTSCMFGPYFRLSIR